MNKKKNSPEPLDGIRIFRKRADGDLPGLREITLEQFLKILEIVSLTHYKHNEWNIGCQTSKNVYLCHCDRDNSSLAKNLKIKEKIYQVYTEMCRGIFEAIFLNVYKSLFDLIISESTELSDFKTDKLIIGIVNDEIWMQFSANTDTIYFIDGKKCHYLYLVMWLKNWLVI